MADRTKRRIVCCFTQIVIGKSIANGWKWQSRVPQGAFERLELYMGKLIRTVLRGERSSDASDLPDTFGRTHRSDQAVPPEYVLLSTELGGEKRFRSTIARRLGSVGALTKGERGAAENGHPAKNQLEREESLAASSLRH